MKGLRRDLQLLCFLRIQSRGISQIFVHCSIDNIVIGLKPSGVEQR